jgi:hypothetical protein
LRKELVGDNAISIPPRVRSMIEMGLSNSVKLPEIRLSTFDDFWKNPFGSIKDIKSRNESFVKLRLLEDSLSGCGNGGMTSAGSKSLDLAGFRTRNA